MLVKALEDGTFKKMQLSAFPELALFSQEIVPDASGNGDDTIVVRYHKPAEAVAPSDPLQDQSLSVPLTPSADGLEGIAVDLHSSPVQGCRMPQEYSDWFSACFGFPVILVHIGSGRRSVLGTFAPGSAERKDQQASSWLPASIAAYVPWAGASPPTGDKHWLTFTDCSPLLIASESSLADVSARLPASEPAQMHKFRPNIVLDGAGEAPWAEDFWAELTLPSQQRTLLLTANCTRCTSLNVDYETGRPGKGESGTVLKKLMKDRRVDTGSKYSPVFGRYAFLDDPATGNFTIRVGDEVSVTKHNEHRTVYDWPGLGTDRAKKPVAPGA